MTDEKAYQYYFAVKLHFTSQYDVFQYGTGFNGRKQVSEKPDFWLIKHVLKVVQTPRELIEYCASNFLYDNSDMLYNTELAIDNYKHWCRVKGSLNFTLERDLSTISLYTMRNRCTLDDYLNRQVISDLLSQNIEYESLILLDRGLNCDIIDRIAGFDADKYKVRMHKSKQFVNNGALGHIHKSHIDNFLTEVKVTER